MTTTMTDRAEWYTHRARYYLPDYALTWSDYCRIRSAAEALLQELESRRPEPVHLPELEQPEAMLDE